jgi:vancomycin resistance protein YoaR
MSSQTSHRLPTSTAAVAASVTAPLGLALATILGGLLLFGLLLASVPAIYSLIYSDQIFPGVSVAGIDVSGLTKAEAAARLGEVLDFPQRGKIVFQEGNQVWIATPQELGLYLDPQTSALAAYQVGRLGSLLNRMGEQFRAGYRGMDLAPLFVFDERMADTFLRSIAAQVDKQVIEADLSVSGVEVIVRSGQVGRTLDVDAGLVLVQAQLETLTDGIIPLVVNETPPVILDAAEQAEIARRILSAPLVLQLPDAGQGDPGPWTFEPQVLATMLNIERTDSAERARYQVGLNSSLLRTFLEGVAPSLVRLPQDARFIFNDETRQLDRIQNATIGRALDIETSLQAIQQQVVAGEHTILLDLEYTLPAVTDDLTAEQLGITQSVSVYTSYFYGSSAERIQNISTAASRFHGVLVPPGATFSMAEVLGDVSLDNGYAEALIIFGDRTIKGVGGGVCQVSTTLFRTAFFGGFQIDERYAHAYRVGYYEQTASGGINPSLAGLDATVYAPVVDFKFTNDTPYWLLMETYVNAQARTLTWKFYSSSDGRTVEWNTSGPQNIVEPPEPLYEENPELATGEIKQVDWEAEGADVTVTRIVWRSGVILHEDLFQTHYLPWRAVYQYGPGTEVPTPEPTPEP